MTAHGGLSARIETPRAEFVLRLDLEVEPGEVAAVVGPNGAGKSTALRTLAGLLRPVAGLVRLGERVLDDPTEGLHVRPADRGIGVMFQDYLLFPHLSALENVAFGLLARGHDRRDALSRAQRSLDGLGVGEFRHIRPRRLSGGQAQRVALARALVLEPPLLLLDEPLAALDASTRVDVRSDLADQLRAFGGATVLVTHDPVDALALADELIVLERGAVAQRGSPSAVSRAPRGAYVADLLGMCVLPSAGGPPVVFDPSRVALSAERPADAASAVVVYARVRGVEQVGNRLRMLLSTVDSHDRFTADVPARGLADRLLRRDERVWATISPEV